MIPKPNQRALKEEKQTLMAERKLRRARLTRQQEVNGQEPADHTDNETYALCPTTFPALVRVVVVHKQQHY
jgi:hypothetical protein